MITRCKHCGCYIDTDLGEESPGATQDNEGSKDDPRATGEWDDICDQCNYGKGLRGGPSSIATYDGDDSEWE